MLDLIREGGAGSLPVLLFGFISLITAGLFVWRPDRKKLAYLRGMSTATVFAVLAAVSADIAATLHNTVEHPVIDPWYQNLMLGLGESMAPAILGFALLGLVWMLTAFGLRRFEGAD